ncbi:ABC transporter substrate-binding protein [Nocardioides silvaticus]|uniref:ABC transporter substrate-binding protein n=2 Tax=Nocardioides silvaticus TaxID=2201891 RepID=A0A316TGN1_9ACTN|nr:ABC transporter substrate-binding protein [Nocardioides silvaticus]
MPMKPMNARDPFKVGLVAIALLGLLGGVVLFLSLANFGTTSYTAVLEHTGGLRAGESVQVHGVTKGEVTAIELEEDRVVVEFALDSDIELGSRTEATVKVATLLGTHYLEVDPSGAGELADGTIPVERTSVPYNLQDVIESGAGALEELDPELLAESLTQFASTLGATQEEIRPALEGVARLSESVASRSDQVGALLTAARSVTDQLAASNADIIEMMKQTNLVVAEVTSRRQAIHRLLVETTELARALESIVESTRGKLQPALRDLNEVIAFLNQQDDELQHVLDVMAPAARYVANAAGNGPWVDLFAHEPALPADDVACRMRRDCR